MFSTLPAEVRRGRINLLEKAKLPEGTRLLVTVMPENESLFWTNASHTALDKIWNNKEDDVYEKLLSQ